MIIGIVNIHTMALLIRVLQLERKNQNLLAYLMGIWVRIHPQYHCWSHTRPLHWE